MPTSDSDWIQDGTVTTYDTDGSVYEVVQLPPQGLATEDTANKLVEWLDANIPEGALWTLRDDYELMSQGQQHFNCACWMAVAANGFSVNAGNCWYNLFAYPNPTQAQVEELHAGASKQVET